MSDPLAALTQFFVATFGSRNERIVRDMLLTVEEVNRLEPMMQKLSDRDLSAKTQEFRNRLNDAFGGKLAEATREEIDAKLAKLLPEAFAVVREAGRRVVRTPSTQDPQPMRHFDVQLIGGMVLNRGCIAEMTTGEGKTLVATLAAYLNALPGRGVHIVTVNDYLARRDCLWMGPLYEFLGLSSGAIQMLQDYESKRRAYNADITFGKDSEFGFDYLRDNMRWSVEEQVQRRGLYYAIVDEVDSVLIDEARTPLIISGPSEESIDKYGTADAVARKLRKEEHFTVKEKERTAHLTEAGVNCAERMLKVGSIYAGPNADWPHHIENAVRAHHLWKRDVHYVVKDNEIVIVDEFTGRLMPGRRWSDGLHQAIEAKEGIKIVGEDQTLATVTYQNYFRLYKKLAGMTGTAMTEATEFHKIYKLDVIRCPTNRPLIRAELPDVVYRTEPEKFNAIEEEVVETHGTGRPVLVGTISIEKSEVLSERLKRRGIKHEVLNAKHHEREAAIVAQAGQMGHVTIATNMAGRGTDIVLGNFTPEELLEHWKSRDLAPKDLTIGAPDFEKRILEHWARHYLNEETFKKTPPEEYADALRDAWKEQRMPPLKLCTTVADVGGLHIIGTERHEARRIDNQLRGRAGRQGDPGSSRFFLSLQDDLMRIFASERVGALLKRIGLEEGMAIEHGLVTRSIERAQKKVEEYHFEMRKHLLEYDQPMDEQRKAIYGLRQQILEQGDLKELILEMIEDILAADVAQFVPTDLAPEDRNGRPMLEWAARRGAELSLDEWKNNDRPELKKLFRERKAAAEGKDPDRIASDTVGAAADLYLDREAAYYRWDMAGLSRWARHMGLAVEASDIEGSIQRRLREQIEKAAREQHAATSAEGAVQLCMEQAVDTYIARAVAMEEWDLRGLEGWAEAAEIALPINQWQRSAEEQAEEDLNAQVTAVREQITERLTRAIRNRAPADLIARIAAYELRRRIAAAATGEDKADLGDILGAVDKGLSLSLTEADAQSAIGAVRAEVESRLAQQLKAVMAGRPLEEAQGVCADNMVDTYLSISLAQPEANLAGFAEMQLRKYGVLLDPFDISKLTPAELQDRALAAIRESYDKREKEITPERMRLIERLLLLQKIDVKWKDHLLNMDHLKGGIGLRGYAQVDPKVEFTRESRLLFDQMKNSVRQEVTDLILRLDIGQPPPQSARPAEPESPAPQSPGAPAALPNAGKIWGGGREQHGAAQPTAAQSEGATLRKQQEAAIAGTQRREKLEPIKSAARVGRNDPCPCGSGKKYKKCCGR